jgi:hypothetical protein
MRPRRLEVPLPPDRLMMTELPDALEELMQHLTRQARPSAGRPTREQAEQRHEELLDRALEQFLEKGFELATMEAIAASGKCLTASRFRAKGRLPTWDHLKVLFARTRPARRFG